MSTPLAIRHLLLLPAHAPRPPPRLQLTAWKQLSGLSSRVAVFLALFLSCASAPLLSLASCMSSSSSFSLCGKGNVTASFDPAEYPGPPEAASNAVRLIVGFDNNTLPEQWRPVLLLSVDLFRYNLSKFSQQLSGDFVDALQPFSNARLLTFEVMDLQINPNNTSEFYLYYDVNLGSVTVNVPLLASNSSLKLSDAADAYVHLETQFKNNHSELYLEGVVSRYLKKFSRYCLNLKSFSDSCDGMAFSTPSYPPSATVSSADTTPFTQQPAFLAILFSIIGAFLLMSVCFTVWKCARARRLLGVERIAEERRRRRARKGAIPIPMEQITAISVENEGDDDEEEDQEEGVTAVERAVEEKDASIETMPKKKGGECEEGRQRDKSGSSGNISDITSTAQMLPERNTNQHM